MKKVMVAMSGGVDSCAAAILLKEQYEVIGATLKLHEDESCCEDARRAAEKLGIEHQIFDFSELFREKVIGSFVHTYEQGGTPNPCVDCNRLIKFGALLDKALELGCDFIATGHYARIERDAASGRYLLKKAKGDNSKDQSYVLCDLTQEQLSHILFPLGELQKAQVRELAAKNGLDCVNKPESQDICFVPDGDYAGFIRGFTGKTYEEGNVVDTSGRVVGRHGGLINYTVGQRRGLGIAFGKPVYVLGKNAAENTLSVGSEQDLFSKSLRAEKLNWIMFEKLEEPVLCRAKIRYRMEEKSCAVYPEEDGSVTVSFSEPQRAVTPGQRVVFYDGETVIGGGVISADN